MDLDLANINMGKGYKISAERDVNKVGNNNVNGSMYREASTYGFGRRYNS